MNRTLIQRLVIGCILLPLCAFKACTQDQLTQAAQASDTAAQIVNELQLTETNAYNLQLVPKEDHLFIQREILALSQLGTTTDNCIRNAGNAAGAVVCANSAIDAASQMQAEGATGLKSTSAQQQFALAITGIKSVLQSLLVTLGSPPRPAPPAPTPVQ